MAAPSSSRRGPRAVRRVDDFVRSYTKGFSKKDFQRLFDRDAARAYSVLTRDQDLGPEPKVGFRLFVYRARILFLGLSYKLSPARRVLFAVALILAFVAFEYEDQFACLERFRNEVEQGRKMVSNVYIVMRVRIAVRMARRVRSGM